MSAQTPLPSEEDFLSEARAWAQKTEEGGEGVPASTSGNPNHVRPRQEETETKDANNELEAERRRAAVLERELRAYAAHSEELEREMDRLSRSVSEELSRLTLEAQRSSEELNGLRGELSATKAELRSTQAALRTTEAELSELRHRRAGTVENSQESAAGAATIIHLQERLEGMMRELKASARREALLRQALTGAGRGDAATNRALSRKQQHHDGDDGDDDDHQHSEAEGDSGEEQRGKATDLQGLFSGIAASAPAAAPAPLPFRGTSATLVRPRITRPQDQQAASTVGVSVELAPSSPSSSLIVDDRGQRRTFSLGGVSVVNSALSPTAAVGVALGSNAANPPQLDAALDAAFAAARENLMTAATTPVSDNEGGNACLLVSSAAPSIADLAFDAFFSKAIDGSFERLRGLLSSSPNAMTSVAVSVSLLDVYNGLTRDALAVRKVPAADALSGSAGAANEGAFLPRGRGYTAPVIGVGAATGTSEPRDPSLPLPTPTSAAGVVATRVQVGTPSDATLVIRTGLRSRSLLYQPDTADAGNISNGSSSSNNETMAAAKGADPFAHHRGHAVAVVHVTVTLLSPSSSSSDKADQIKEQSPSRIYHLDLYMVSLGLPGWVAASCLPGLSKSEVRRLQQDSLQLDGDYGCFSKAWLTTLDMATAAPGDSRDRLQNTLAASALGTSLFNAFVLPSSSSSTSTSSLANCSLLLHLCLPSVLSYEGDADSVKPLMMAHNLQAQTSAATAAAEAALAKKKRQEQEEEDAAAAARERETLLHSPHHRREGGPPLKPATRASASASTSASTSSQRLHFQPHPNPPSRPSSVLDGGSEVEVGPGDSASVMMMMATTTTPAGPYYYHHGHQHQHQHQGLRSGSGGGPSSPLFAPPREGGRRKDALSRGYYLSTQQQPPRRKDALGSNPVALNSSHQQHSNTNNNGFRHSSSNSRGLTAHDEREEEDAGAGDTEDSGDHHQQQHPTRSGDGDAPLRPRQMSFASQGTSSDFTFGGVSGSASATFDTSTSLPMVDPASLSRHPLAKATILAQASAVAAALGGLNISSSSLSGAGDGTGRGAGPAGLLSPSVLPRLPQSVHDVDAEAGITRYTDPLTRRIQMEEERKRRAYGDRKQPPPTANAYAAAGFPLPVSYHFRSRSAGSTGTGTGTGGPGAGGRAASVVSGGDNDSTLIIGPNGTGLGASMMQALNESAGRGSVIFGSGSALSGGPAGPAGRRASISGAAAMAAQAASQFISLEQYTAAGGPAAAAANLVSSETFNRSAQEAAVKAAKAQAAAAAAAQRVEERKRKERLRSTSGNSSRGRRDLTSTTGHTSERSTSTSSRVSEGDHAHAQAQTQQVAFVNVNGQMLPVLIPVPSVAPPSHPSSSSATFPPSAGSQRSGKGRSRSLSGSSIGGGDAPVTPGGAAVAAMLSSSSSSASSSAVASLSLSSDAMAAILQAAANANAATASAKDERRQSSSKSATAATSTTARSSSAGRQKGLPFNSSYKPRSASFLPSAPPPMPPPPASSNGTTAAEAQRKAPLPAEARGALAAAAAAGGGGGRGRSSSRSRHHHQQQQQQHRGQPRVIADDDIHQLDDEISQELRAQQQLGGGGGGGGGHAATNTSGNSSGLLDVSAIRPSYHALLSNGAGAIPHQQHQQHQQQGHRQTSGGSSSNPNTPTRARASASASTSTSVPVATGGITSSPPPRAAAPVSSPLRSAPASPAELRGNPVPGMKKLLKKVADKYNDGNNGSNGSSSGDSGEGQQPSRLLLPPNLFFSLSAAFSGEDGQKSGWIDDGRFAAALKKALPSLSWAEVGDAVEGMCLSGVASIDYKDFCSALSSLAAGAGYEVA